MPANSAQIARTNGDLVAAVVGAGREHLAAVGRWAAEHPDEAAIAAAPVLFVLLGPRRGRHLSISEAILLSQLGYWGGVLALSHYRRWKAAPLQPPALVRIGEPCKKR